MAIAGSLTYDTQIDKNGFEKGLKSLTSSVKSGGAKIKDIISALGITKLISTAISTINNSIDGAVSRIDTLNNFPKVMSNLGIESEASTKAINKLSDGLQGIPTTLDDAALAVQRFTSKNGQVDKSVDLFLAVNNALLAGGASADIQSSAMEQLSQAYAKGKPDMVEWRSIQTAMPAQLKQISKAMLGNRDSIDEYLKKAKEYAKQNPMSSTAKELIEQLEEVKKGSGDMTTALGTALRTGIISMDDFMDTVVKLNKEGSGEFLSFEKQAKNSTGGIKTSITNAKTAITRGVAGIIKAFDEMLKKNGLGGISTVISKVGSNAEKVLKKAAEQIPKVVSKIKDTYNWVVKNQTAIKTLVGVLASLTAGYLAYKTVLVAIKAINTIQNIVGTASAFLSLIPAIKSAKDAMTLLNMAFSANPVGLVIAGVVTLAGVLTTFAMTATKSQREAEEFTEKVSASKQALDEYSKSIDDNANKQLNQIEYVSRLKEELKKLVDENGKVTEGNQGRVSYILNELNEALQTEYKLNGDIVESYQDIQNSIDDLIEKKKAEVLLNAEYEKYQNAIENQGNAVDELKQAYDNLGMSLKEARQKYQQMEDGTIKASKKEKELLKEKIDAYEIAETTVKQYTENVKQYETDYANFTEGKYDEIGKTIKNTTKDWTDSTLTQLGDSIIAQKEELEKYKTIYEETGNEVARQQMEQAQANLQSLQDEFSVRAQVVAEKGLEENEKWRTLSENNALSYTSGMSQLQIITGQALADTTSVIETNTSVENGMSNLGSKGKNTYQRGIAPMSEDTKNKLAEIAGIVNQDTSVESSSNNLSKKTANVFGDNVANMPIIMQRETSHIANVLNSDMSIGDGAKRLGNEADINFNNNVHGHLWGSDLAANLSSGMMSRRSAISNAASTIANIIHSFLGHSVPEKGPLADEMSYMPDMIENLVKTLYKASPKLREATSNVAEMMADTIKENLDLTRLQASVEIKKINDNALSNLRKVTITEKNSTATRAGFQTNKDSTRTIQNDNGININNTQNFYSKNATPYEEQKQAKQQLRRLAYGL